MSGLYRISGILFEKKIGESWVPYIIIILSYWCIFNVQLLKLTRPKLPITTS